ncbi:MAG: aldehyde dehydrogenase family protein [Sphingomonadales bacterium]|nr:aldehyde dehydrogenase family protein [Sphingomonadales bacterium]
MRLQTELLIDGEWRPSRGGSRIEVTNPYDSSVICDIAEARGQDVDDAVAAAAQAFPKWRALPAMARGGLLLKLAAMIEEHADELAALESLDTGHPIRDARHLDVPRTAAVFRYFGGMADKFEGRVIPAYPGFLSYVDNEPIGVVGQIVPWNFPLMFTSWKMAPALAAGNCVVLKPSELTPLSTLRIGELMMEAGFPRGVVNIVPGFGQEAGQRIAEHPGVGKVAFTGSTATGRRIVEASSGNLKKIQLELGGKGPNIIFKDANLQDAVNGSAWAIFHNQGQACIAGSRIIVHEDIADAFIARFTELAASIRLGDPSDPDTEMGPVTSRPHQERVLQYCAYAVEDGGEILTGGRAPDGDLAKGFFVEPTVVRAAPDDRVCQDEVFGPFVSVTTFRTDEEALEIANNTIYGLGSGLWTEDLRRAHRFAREIHAGMVWINCYKVVHPGSPFGGVGESGYGREMGFDVMREYTHTKSVWVNYGADIEPYYVR